MINIFFFQVGCNQNCAPRNVRCWLKARTSGKRPRCSHDWSTSCCARRQKQNPPPLHLKCLPRQQNHQRWQIPRKVRPYNTNFSFYFESLKMKCVAENSLLPPAAKRRCIASLKLQRSRKSKIYKFVGFSCEEISLYSQSIH
jgi:hypothetical protein